MRIVLVSMPWAIFNRPSIQLSVLQAYLHGQSGDITVETRHPYLEAAQRIGPETYRLISENNWAGEALYSSLLFPERRDQARAVFRQALGRKIVRSLPDFDVIAAQLDSHLDDWLEREDFKPCSLASFSICFSQLPGSILAAGRLKERYPRLPIVLGGSTCAPAIGASLLKVFPAIDFIITGEGERPLHNLCLYLAGETPHPGPNVLQRQNEPQMNRKDTKEYPDNNEIPDLNTLPLPDFDDYFAELKQTGLSVIPTLPLEFSRGCWWNKCAFCNLNLQWCGYRCKKSERMLRELKHLQHRYHCLDFTFTDNVLPPGEADRFFSALQKDDHDLNFFGEIRVLRKQQTYVLYQKGGLHTVQIGIESFSNTLLQRLNKGTRVLDNIAAMKFVTAAGIKLEGNLILEFPGSTQEQVNETMRVLDFVLPFQPLQAAGFFMGHGCPVWGRPRDYGVEAILQHPYNRKLYPASVLSRLVMLIKYGRGDHGYQKRLWKPVREKMQAWAEFHQQRKNTCLPPLSYRDGGDFIIIRQERPGGPALQHRLRDLSRKIYLACDQPVAIKELLHTFNSITEEKLSTFLAGLEQKHLLFRDQDDCLALAVRQPER